MYQSVDEHEEDETGTVSEETSRLKIIAGILVGVAILAGVAIFSASNQPDVNPALETSADQYAIYTKALSEPHPALRRARLLDFINNYPDHERKPAAEAQLAIIQQADDRDWLSLQEVIFEPSQSKPAKIAALDLYEEMWGSVLLGSRETEVLELREQLDKETEPPEEQDDSGEDFTPQPDKFDASIDGTKLAGDVVVAESSYTRSRPVIINRPNNPSIVDIKPPTLRKDRRPRYPSRAERRGVHAEVVLSLNIDDEGEVQMTEVISVSASKYRKDFVRAAERAALRTKYNPRTINGEPVATTGFLRRYVFRIDG